MAKTHVLTTTNVIRMSAGAIYDDWYSTPSAGYLQVGKVGNYYALPCYVFDANELAALRDKEISSMELRIRSYEYPQNAGFYQMGYKANAGTSEGRISSVIGDLVSLPHTTSGGYTTIDLTGKALPLYGFVLSAKYGVTEFKLLDNSSNSGSGFVAATLTVVTSDDGAVRMKKNGTVYTGTIHAKKNGVIYDGVSYTKKNGQIYIIG